MGGVKGLREKEHQLVVVKEQLDVKVRTLGWSWMMAILWQDAIVREYLE